jgi:NAD(P)-dependent dehydrogenase (short-subunit alcohol dehydrogenase family)
MNTETKVIIITGGGQGIGKATAKHFLMKNFAVVIAEFDKAAGLETENEFKALGKIKFIHCDVSVDEQVKNMVTETLRLFGRIDILINSAAISANKPILDLSFEEWCNVINVNLSGAFLCSKYCVPYLKESKGSIVNMCSTRAFMSEANTEAYSASKGGIYSLTHALAVSLGPDVRVNCISPGWIEVGPWKKASERYEPVHSAADRLQHISGRVGTPEDIANMIDYLTAPENSFITGANFFVDGGMTRKMIYV